MLQDLVTQVCAELEISQVPQLNENKFILFSIGGIDVEMRDLKPGVSLFANICECPQTKKEDFFLMIMKANYLGQATGSSRIGMSQDEKFLTLSLGMPYEMNYRTFRETVEDFVNFVLYWKEEVANFVKQEAVI